MIVIRLSLGTRLVNLLPIAQRTNALTNGVDGRTWATGREFESWKLFINKIEFPHVNNLKNTLPGSPEIRTASWWHVGPFIRSGPEYPDVPTGESVIRLSLGRPLVNLSPVAPRTTNASILWDWNLCWRDLLLPYGGDRTLHVYICLTVAQRHTLTRRHAGGVDRLRPLQAGSSLTISISSPTKVDVFFPCFGVKHWKFCTHALWALAKRWQTCAWAIFFHVFICYLGIFGKIGLPWTQHSRQN